MSKGSASGFLQIGKEARLRDKAACFAARATLKENGRSPIGERDTVEKTATRLSANATDDKKRSSIVRELAGFSSPRL
jgi:hypothetical protein